MALHQSLPYLLRNLLRNPVLTIICPETLRNLTTHLHLDPPEPHQVAAPETSGNSQGICTGTLRNLCTGTLRNITEYVHRKLPEPHKVSAPEPPEPHKVLEAQGG